MVLSEAGTQGTKSKVSIVRCADYDEKRVEEAVLDSIRLIGGLKGLIKKKDKVLLKVNTLAPAEPERAVTTHPSLVKAAIKLVREAGGEPIVADAPGFFFAGGKNMAFIKSGIKEAAESMGAEARQFETVENPFIETQVPDGALLKTIFAARLALEADVIISLPKLKTHSNTWYTGAVKNMFGAVAPKTRKIAHNLATYEKFSGALVDIYSVTKPKLAIMDAVIGMEGEGPRHGSPKQAGLILSSYDCVALDAVASKIIGYEPENILTTKIASERGLGTGELDRIEVLGERIGQVRTDFKKPSGRMVNVPPVFAKIANSLVYVRPELKEEKCKKCAICAKSCPAGAISMSPYPKIDRKLCIECYCCNEMCPEGAMEIKKSWIAKMFAEGTLK